MRRVTGEQQYKALQAVTLPSCLRLPLLVLLLSANIQPAAYKEPNPVKRPVHKEPRDSVRVWWHCEGWHSWPPLEGVMRVRSALEHRAMIEEAVPSGQN